MSGPYRLVRLAAGAEPLGRGTRAVLLGKPTRPPSDVFRGRAPAAPRPRRATRPRSRSPELESGHGVPRARRVRATHLGHPTELGACVECPETRSAANWLRVLVDRFAGCDKAVKGNRNAGLRSAQARLRPEGGGSAQYALSPQEADAAGGDDVALDFRTTAFDGVGHGAEVADEAEAGGSSGS